MAGRIFVNYRRDDSAPHALNIAQYLEKAFGARSVFIDVDRIRSGEDFQTVLNDHLAQCKVILAIIGPRWLDVRDQAGRRRLDDPGDWVRLEIASALQRKIRVIPVLVGGAAIPAAADLPADLKPLAKLQAVALTTNGFRYEMTGLASDIRATVGYDLRRAAMISGAIVTVLSLLVIAYALGVRVPGSQGTATINTDPGGSGKSFETQLSAACKADLAKMRSSASIAAFAIASNGECGFSSGYPKAVAARTTALDACKKKAGSECRVVELNEGDWTLSPECVAAYDKWKSMPAAKVFTLAKSGHCAWASDKAKLDDARTEALAACERLTGECKVHDSSAGDWTASATCKQEIEIWRKKAPGRAFAVARNGLCASSWSYADMTEARDWALKECNQLGSECRVSEEYEGNYEINDECKPILAKWQQLRGRGAFAGGKTGACGYSYEYSSRSEADSRAIKECETNKGVNCKILYQK